MLKPRHDLTLALPYVRYGRMSDDTQNPRSPDQQFDTIDSTKANQRRPWIFRADYRDDGISGRLMRKRPGFMKMLEDIRTGRLRVDLILVDTIERFARVDKLPEIRRELHEKYGVLVLTADTGFADPTTQGGSVMAMFEAARATEDGRIKAHNVLRGKRDAARRKHWPGGPVPFGYRLESVLVGRGGGRVEVDHSLLVPDAETRWIPPRAFALAREEGNGPNVVAQALNADPEIPARHKPFLPETIRYWFRNEIYKGDLVWEENETGIVDDVRVVRPNAEEDVLRVPEFCEPIVDRDVWEEVAAQQRVRSAKYCESRDRAAAAREAALEAGLPPLPKKRIEPLTRGLALKYLLSGLVRCGTCGRSMRAQASGRPSKSGTTYAYYTCPGIVSGACSNRHRPPESWLRESTLALVRARLFPPATADGVAPDWLAGLVAEVELELRRLEGGESDRRPALRSEAEGLRTSISGWMQSLGRPDLPEDVRQDLEAEYARARSRLGEIESALEALDSTGPRLRRLLDPSAAQGRLDRLAEVLAGGNATSGNLELGRHVDRIEARADGSVVLRTTVLGIFEGASALLARGTGGSPSTSEVDRVRPRRRPPLRVEGPTIGAPGLAADPAASLDPDRFAGLEERWFHEDVLPRRGPSCWSSDHAAEVADVRLANPKWSVTQLAAHFDVSAPTIRKALALAAELGLVPEGSDRPGHVRPSWPADHAAEVDQVRRANPRWSVPRLAAHFGVSEPTLRKALALAADPGEEVDLPSARPPLGADAPSES